MTEDWVPLAAAAASIAVAIITAAAAIWQKRTDRPIRQAEAEAATTQMLAGAGGAWDTLIDNLREDVTVLRERDRTREEQMRDLAEQVRVLRRDLDRYERTACIQAQWIDDVITRWQVYRAQDTPPPRPQT